MRGALGSRITSELDLCEGTHLCVSGNFVVFLSLSQDRYRCVRLSELDRAGDALVRQGLLKRSSDNSRAAQAAPQATCPRATRDLGLEPWAPAGRLFARQSWRRIGRFSVAILSAEHDLHWRSMAQIVAQVESWKVRHSSRIEALRARTTEFQSLRPLYPRPYRCLFDSLALLHYLHRFGLGATWVFGVRGEPFEAHCWLQSGETVLNDSVDRVVAHTPCAAF